MKTRSFAQTFTAFVFALGATATIPALLNNEILLRFKQRCSSYSCSHSRGDIPVIRWLSTYFSANYAPVRRCMDVSNRFQVYYDNGTLNYLTTGQINRQPVLCVARSLGSGCSEVLITLEPRDNPNRVLQELLNVVFELRDSSYQRQIPEVSEQSIDLNKYLNTAPVEKGISQSLNSPEKHRHNPLSLLPTALTL